MLSRRHSIVPTNGAAAPTPATPIAIARAVASAAASASTCAASVGLAGRWSHKGKVDLDSLVEELGLVGAIDGGAGLFEGRILNQCVTLLRWPGNMISYFVLKCTTSTDDRT